ncbi:thermonuclease family protein [Cyanobium sp. PCC 7001]|uniref:thermonuclease family protein n=1 Tax=Cyanobium sp. PCC 7001 TaxID=180281 RepID=UPI0008FED88B
MKKGVRAKVLRVIDGDTFKATFRRNSRRIKRTIRIACIDAPEIDQKPLGKRAKDALTGILNRKEFVRLNIKGNDRFGRTVSQVAVGRSDVGVLMVKKGQATVDDLFSAQCSNTRKLSNAERQAQRRSRGIWANQNTSEPSIPSTATGIPQFNGSRVITCPQIRSRTEADAWLRAGHTYLDGDKDGIACESITA